MIQSFRTFLLEGPKGRPLTHGELLQRGRDAHSWGTNAVLSLDSKSQQHIQSWAQTNMPHGFKVLPSGGLHTTLIQSSKGVPALSKRKWSELPIKAKVTGVHHVGGGRIALLLDSPGLMELHEKLRNEHGMNHMVGGHDVFFQPHISVAEAAGRPITQAHLDKLKETLPHGLEVTFHASPRILPQRPPDGWVFPKGWKA